MPSLIRRHLVSASVSAAAAAAAVAVAAAAAGDKILLCYFAFRFVLVRENIPSFLPSGLPERLLLAGKSLLYSR